MDFLIFRSLNTGLPVKC